MRGTLINERPAKSLIIELAKQCHEEMEHPPLKLKTSYWAAIVIGLIASEVYYLPTLRATEGDSLGLRDFATIATIGTNAILNVFFNILAVDSLWRIRDPLSAKLTVPRPLLWFNLIISAISACCVAFVGLDWESKFSIILAFLQLFNYTAQHYTGVVEFMELLRELLRDIIVKVRFCVWGIEDEITDGLRRKSEILAHLDRQYLLLSKEFSQSINSLSEFYQQIDEVEYETLIDDVVEAEPILESKPTYCPRPIWLGLYGCPQLAGLASQVVANVGYYNSTINAFLSWFNLGLAWTFSTGSVAPFYILSFVVSWNSIDKIIDFLIKIAESVKKRQLSIIVDEIPYAIRRTPKFSFVSGGFIASLACLSPFTALILAYEALYGSNPKNPAHFDDIDPDEQYKVSLMCIVFGASILFNMFPTPFVQDWISIKYLNWFGLEHDKKAIEALELLKTTRHLVSKIDAKFFTDSEEIPDEKKPSHSFSLNQVQPARNQKSCGQLFSNFLCQWWKKLTCRKNQPAADNKYQLMH
jgi:hypothetical protein